MYPLSAIKCVVKGGGDLGTGAAWSLFRAGFTVVVLDIDNPIAVRRTVAFSTALNEGFIDVEGVTAKKAQVNEIIHRLGFEPFDHVPVIADPAWKTLERIRPHVTVDALVNKRNHGTKITEAQFVIAMGPGFSAGEDCHAVVETNRGHNLGRIIYKGPAEENTGKPGSVKGYSYERVLRTKYGGLFRTDHRIGDFVKKGDDVCRVGNYVFRARFDGFIRGLLPDNFTVAPYAKLGDIDPRDDRSYCFSISDKSRSIGRAVLEAVLAAMKMEPGKFGLSM